MIQVTEFFDAYPNYKLGFKENNEPTATEKLLNQKYNSIAVSPEHKGRYYQAFWLTGKAMTSLMSCFPTERKVYDFCVNNGQATFRGSRRGKRIVCVCMETHERVLFCQAPFDKVEIVIG